MAAIGVPREAPNRQTWAVVRRSENDHAVVAVVYHEGEYFVEEVGAGLDLPKAIMHCSQRAWAGS